MSSFGNLLGLRTASETPNLAPYHTLFHFVFAYVILSTRGTKLYLKIDHNVNPRQDAVKYGERAVKEGKITQRQLDFLHRNEGAHQNAMDSFPVFTSAMIFATIAGVSNERINFACTIYTAARIAFAVLYLTVEKSRGLSLVRSLAWWTGNIACMRLFWAAGQAINAVRI